MLQYRHAKTDHTLLFHLFCFSFQLLTPAGTSFYYRNFICHHHPIPYQQLINKSSFPGRFYQQLTRNQPSHAQILILVIPSQVSPQHDTNTFYQIDSKKFPDYNPGITTQNQNQRLYYRAKSKSHKNMKK